jgi:hypothetical protein
VPVPNQTITPVRQLEILHSGQERLGLQLHSLREKPSSARAQDKTGCELFCSDSTRTKAESSSA